MIKSPCLNCEQRKLHCHSTCEEYLAYEVEHKNYKREIDKQKQKMYGNRDYITESIKRMQKNKRKK